MLAYMQLGDRMVLHIKNYGRKCFTVRPLVLASGKYIRLQCSLLMGGSLGLLYCVIVQ
jgi:hypothetical protein